MKYIYTFFFLIFIISCSDATKKVTPKDYLDEVIEIIEEHSVKRDSVDFNKIKSETYARLKNAHSIETCYPIVKIIQIDLGDRHSFFMTKEQVKKWQTPSNINEVITFNAKLIDQNVGYIRMKGFGKVDSLSIRQYADTFRASVVKKRFRSNRRAVQSKNFPVFPDYVAGCSNWLDCLVFLKQGVLHFSNHHVSDRPFFVWWRIGCHANDVPRVG